MNMLQYELFASVARTLNISKTAQEYYISQPAVSHHIKSLENSLGVELVRRTKRGVTLTSAGQELLPYVQEILAINNRAENRMHNIAKGTMGHISIAALSSSSNQVSDCLGPLYAKHPDIQADVSLLEGSELTEALRAGTHDFFFAVFPMIPDNMGYESRIISRDKMCLFVNRSIAEKIDMDDWSSIAKLPFVSVPRADVSLDKRIMTICHNRGFEPKIVNIYNRAESVVLSVNAGIGVAMLPAALGQLYQRPNVVTFPIEGDDAIAQTAFIWNPDKIGPTGEVFRDIVLEQFPYAQ